MKASCCTVLAEFVEKELKIIFSINEKVESLFGFDFELDWEFILFVFEDLSFGDGESEVFGKCGKDFGFVFFVIFFLINCKVYDFNKLIVSKRDRSKELIFLDVTTDTTLFSHGGKKGFLKYDDIELSNSSLEND